MAVFSSNGSNAAWVLSLKVLLASTLTLSAVLLLKLSLPAVAAFLTSELPSLYGLLLAWLRAPYLHILINCIVISIVASTKLQHRADDEHQASEVARAVYVAAAAYAAPLAGAVVPWEAAEDLKVPWVVASAEYGVYGSVYDPRSVRSDSPDFSFLTPNEYWTKKRPVSARFGHRKSAKSSPAGSLSLSLSLSPLFLSTTDFQTPLTAANDDAVGRQLWVSRPKRNDTPKSKHRTTTAGRAEPLARHLRKSDTWDSHARRNDESSPPPPPKIKKSETFFTRPGPASAASNRPASPSPGSGKLSREPSLGVDDLNRRVEAFISKELQRRRQEALNEMFSRGAV